MLQIYARSMMIATRTDAWDLVTTPAEEQNPEKWQINPQSKSWWLKRAWRCFSK